MSSSPRKLALLLVLSGLMVVGLMTGPASASHYRGGDISYQQSGAATNVALQSTTSFRCDAFFGDCATQAVPGATVNIGEAQLNFGDGTTSDSQYIVVASNPAENYFTARKDVSHNYPNTTRRNAFYTSCCTISEAARDGHRVGRRRWGPGQSSRVDDQLGERSGQLEHDR